ncbi:hypothetical protein Pcinc_010728 [Petrolisthes cinctipes]|uniref:Uncharacterized protein n=1 Tax=Petrolisthes cinctipes TaxID=88211 RepID=A0AAE1G2C7_PETCI|nr:hypothetical protein Pcinc_010728 [Petrolisthes cinctipes]
MDTSNTAPLYNPGLPFLNFKACLPTCQAMEMPPVLILLSSPGEESVTTGLGCRHDLERGRSMGCLLSQNRVLCLSGQSLFICPYCPHSQQVHRDPSRDCLRGSPRVSLN